MSIAGPEETPFFKSRLYPLPPHPLSYFDKVMQKQYGPLYISQPAARASKAIMDRGICCSSGVCQLCPVNSKFTIENSFKKLYEDPRVTIEYDSQVYSLELNHNQVNGVLYVKNGKDKKAKGDTVALGANAIFNAHILLNAGDTNPATGKNLSEQVGTFGKVYLGKLDHLGGSGLITANGYKFYNGDHRKDHAACLMETYNDTTIRNAPGKWRKVVKLKFVFEDIPQENNLVKKSENRLKPAVTYNGHTSYPTKAYAKLEEKLNQYFSFLDIDDIELNDGFEETEYHICSTTRMSKGPDEGVIDKHLIHHQYRNLFVLGSSAFPTISPSNPTLTLAALSLMAADKSF